MRPSFYECPIAPCGWQHSVTPPETMPAQWKGDVSKFLFDQMLAAAIIDDEAVGTHLKTHSAAELDGWITTLKRDVRRAEDALFSAQAILQAASGLTEGLRAAHNLPGPAETGTESIQEGPSEVNEK